MLGGARVAERTDAGSDAAASEPSVDVCDEEEEEEETRDIEDSLSEGEMPSDILGLPWSMGVWSPRSSEGELPALFLIK
jgi:hypothetical protein